MDLRPWDSSQQPGKRAWPLASEAGTARVLGLLGLRTGFAARPALLKALPAAAPASSPTRRS